MNQQPPHDVAPRSTPESSTTTCSSLASATPEPSADRAAEDARLRKATRRENSLALAALAATALIGFQTLALHPTDLLVGRQRRGQNDLTSTFLAIRDLPRLLASAPDGWPAWNPHSMAGVPVWGNPQAALFYPPNWIFLFVDATSAVSWMMILHHLWAGLGVYLFCRRLGVGWASSLVGGILYQLAPFYVAQTGEGHFNQTCVAAWLPWGLLAYERFRVSPSASLVGLTTVFSLTFFAGHVQELFYLILVLSLFLAFDLIAAWRRGDRWQTAALARGWIAVGLLTAGLIAVDLLPIWTYSRLSARGAGMTSAEAGRGLSWASFRELVNPEALGGPDNADRVFYWESVFYFGVVTLPLAAAALYCRGAYPIGRLAALVFFGVNFAFGHGNPIFELCFRLVPGIGHFRQPSRILFLVSLALAVLAAIGMERLLLRTREGKPTSRRSVVALLAAAFVGLVAGLAAVVQIDGAIATIPATTWWALALASAAVAVSRMRNPIRNHAPWGVAAACLLELTVHANGILRTIPQDAVRRNGGVADFLRANADGGRVVAVQELLGDLEAWTIGVDKVQAYEPVPVRHFVYALDALDRRDAKATTQLMLGFEPIRLANLHRPIADLLGVRYVVTVPHKPQAEHDWRRVASGNVPAPFTLRGQMSGRLSYAIYENPTAMPRAFVVGEVRTPAPGENAVTTLTKIDPRRELLLEADVLPPGERAAYAPATIESSSARQLVVTAELEKPGYLVVSDLWYPGWRATDNGVPVKILRGNLAFRAIPLVAGKHRLELRYSPPGSTFGAAVSAAALLATAWMATRLALQRTTPA